MNKGYKYDSYSISGENATEKTKEFHDCSHGVNRRNGFILKDVNLELQPYEPDLPKHSLTMVYPTSVSIKVNGRSMTWNIVSGNRVTTVADISEEDTVQIELVHTDGRTYLFESSSEDNCNAVLFNDVLAVSHMSSDITITLRKSTNVSPVVHFICEDAEGIDEIIVNGSVITPSSGAISENITISLDDFTRVGFSIICSENYTLNECKAYYNSALTDRATLNSNGESFSLSLTQTYNGGNATAFWVVFSAKGEPTTDYTIELHINPQHVSNFALYDVRATEPQLSVYKDYIPITETEQQIRIAANPGCKFTKRTVDGVETSLDTTADNFILTLNPSKYGADNPYVIEYESVEIAEEEEYSITITGLDNAYVSYNGETLEKIASGSTFKSVIHTSETSASFDVIANNGYKFRQNLYNSADGSSIGLMNEEMTEVQVNVVDISQDISLVATVMLIPMYDIRITCPTDVSVSSSSGTVSSRTVGESKVITISGLAEMSDTVITVVSDNSVNIAVSGGCSYSRNDNVVDVSEILSDVDIIISDKVLYIDNELVGNIVAQCAATYQYAKLVAGGDADEEDENSESYIYSNTSPFFKSTNPLYVGKYMVRDGNGNARIDCSTFVGMVLRGITYDKSPYASHTGNNAEWTPSTELSSMYGTEGWEFPELDRQPAGEYNDLGITGYSSIRTAADQAKFLELSGYSVFDVGWDVDNLWYNKDSDAANDDVIPWDPDDRDSWVRFKEQYLCEMLQPGDILFWSKRSWFLNGKSCTLSKYGIAIDGTPHVGDTITVTFNGRSASASTNTETPLTVTITAATFRTAVNNTSGTYVFTFNWRQADRYRKISHVAIMAEKLDKYYQVTTASGDAYDKGDDNDETTQSGGVMYSKLKPYHMRYLCLIIRPNYKDRCSNLNFVQHRNLFAYPPRWSSQLSSDFKGVTYTSLGNSQLKLNGSKTTADGSSTRYIRGTDTSTGSTIKDNVIKLPPGVYEATIKEISGSISTVTQKSGTVYDYTGAGFSLNITTADGNAIGAIDGTSKTQGYVGHFASFRITEPTYVRMGLYIGTNQYDFTDYVIEPSIKLISLETIEWSNATIALQNRGSNAGFDYQTDGSYTYSSSMPNESSATRSFCVRYVRGASYRFKFDSIPKTVNIRLLRTYSSTAEATTGTSYRSYNSSTVRFDALDKTVTIHAGAVGDDSSAQYILFGFSGFEAGTTPHITKIEYCAIDLGTASSDRDLQPYFGLNDIVDVSIIQEVDITGESTPYSSYSVTVKDDGNIFNPAVEDNATQSFEKFQMFEIYSLVCDYGNILNPLELLTPPDYYISKVATARLKSITAGNSNAVFSLIGPIEYYDTQYLTNNELLLSSSVSKVSVKEYLKQIFNNDIDVSAFNDSDMIITPFTTESKTEIARIIAQAFAKFLIETTKGQIGFKSLGDMSLVVYDSNEPFRLSLDKQTQNPMYSQYSEPIDSVKITVNRNNVGYSELIENETCVYLLKSISPEEEETELDDGSNLTGYFTAASTAPGESNTFYDENGNVQNSTDISKIVERYTDVKYLRLRYYLGQKCSYESLKFEGNSHTLDEYLYKNLESQNYKDLSYNLSKIDRDNAGNPKKSGCVVTDDFIDFWFTYDSVGGRLFWNDTIFDCTELDSFIGFASFLTNQLIYKVYGCPIENDSIDYYYQPLGTSKNEYVVTNPLITTTRQAEILAMYLYLVKNRRIYDADSRWRGDCLIQPSDGILTAATIGSGVSKTYENYYSGIVIKNQINYNGGLSEDTVVALPQQCFAEKEDTEEGVAVKVVESGVSVSDGLSIG